MSDNSSNLFLSGVNQMGKSVRNELDQLTFTGLSGTPDSYVNASGKYLRVKGGEDGVEFFDPILSFDDFTDLPVPSTSGQIATVGCDLYIGCEGGWVEFGAGGDLIPPPPEAPDCVGSLEEMFQYTEYRDVFLADNQGAAFALALNGDPQGLVHEVCLSIESNLTQERNAVKIDESTYKWGIFASSQNINVTATPFNDPNTAICTFKEWKSSDLPGFPKNNAQETIFIDKDASITGCFECALEPDQPQCNQVELHLKSTENPITDSSDHNRVITVGGDATVDNTSSLFGQDTITFDGASDYLSVGDTSAFKFLHDNTTDYTIEFWVRPESLGLYSNILGTILGASSQVGVAIVARAAGDLYCHIYVGESGYVFKQIYTEANTVSINTWSHVALVNEVGKDFKLYLNGKSLNDRGSPVNATWTYGIKPFSTANSASPLRVGTLASNVGGHAFKGQIQDIRISKKAVYSANFTPRNSLLIDPC